MAKHLSAPHPRADCSRWPILPEFSEKWNRGAQEAKSWRSVIWRINLNGSTANWAFGRLTESENMCQGCVSNIFGSLGGMRPGLSRRQFLATAASVAALAPAATNAASMDGADLIFRGGSIIPMVGDSRTVEALAVKNGRIAAVGAADAVMGLKSASTEIIDLDGRALLPGFIDPHQHTVTGALINAIFTDCGYTKYKTRDALIAMFRDKAAKAPAGQWLLFTSFDNLLQGGDLMMADLDAVSKDHPILVYYINMHTAAGNAAAFAAAQDSFRYRQSAGRRTLRPRRFGQAQWHDL